MLWSALIALPMTSALSATAATRSAVASPFAFVALPGVSVLPFTTALLGAATATTLPILATTTATLSTLLTTTLVALVWLRRRSATAVVHHGTITVGSTVVVSAAVVLVTALFALLRLGLLARLRRFRLARFKNRTLGLPFAHGLRLALAWAFAGSRSFHGRLALGRLLGLNFFRASAGAFDGFGGGRRLVVAGLGRKGHRRGL
jgi:hypothetical protein